MCGMVARRPGRPGPLGLVLSRPAVREKLFFSVIWIVAVVSCHLSTAWPSFVWGLVMISERLRTCPLGGSLLPRDAPEAVCRFRLSNPCLLLQVAGVLALAGLTGFGLLNSCLVLRGRPGRLSLREFVAKQEKRREFVHDSIILLAISTIKPLKMSNHPRFQWILGVWLTEIMLVVPDVKVFCGKYYSILGCLIVIGEITAKVHEFHKSRRTLRAIFWLNMLKRL